MEHESKVGKFHGRQPLCVHHELEWFNPMTHRRGQRSMGGRGRPYPEASRDEGGRGNGKRTDLAHLGSPRLPELLIVASQRMIIAMHDSSITPWSKAASRRFIVQSGNVAENRPSKW